MAIDHLRGFSTDCFHAQDRFDVSQNEGAIFTKPKRMLIT